MEALCEVLPLSDGSTLALPWRATNQWAERARVQLQLSRQGCVRWRSETMELNTFDEDLVKRALRYYAGGLPQDSTDRTEAAHLVSLLDAEPAMRPVRGAVSEVAVMAAQLALPTMTRDEDGHIELEIRQSDPPVIIVVGGKAEDMMELYGKLAAALTRTLIAAPREAASGG